MVPAGTGCGGVQHVTEDWLPPISSATSVAAAYAPVQVRVPEGMYKCCRSSTPAIVLTWMLRIVPRQQRGVCAHCEPDRVPSSVQRLPEWAWLLYGA
jgi:hypothetical protein